MLRKVPVQLRADLSDFRIRVYNEPLHDCGVSKDRSWHQGGKRGCGPGCNELTS